MICLFTMDDFLSLDRPQREEVDAYFRLYNLGASVGVNQFVFDTVEHRAIFYCYVNDRSDPFKFSLREFNLPLITPLPPAFELAWRVDWTMFYPQFSRYPTDGLVYPQRERPEEIVFMMRSIIVQSSEPNFTIRANWLNPISGGPVSPYTIPTWTTSDPTICDVAYIDPDGNYVVAVIGRPGQAFITVTTLTTDGIKIRGEALVVVEDDGLVELVDLVVDVDPDADPPL